MTTISTKNAPAAIGPYSQAIEINGLVFTSGQIAIQKTVILKLLQLKLRQNRL